jgi:prepilin-type N-terminal cleavage/methylation domain-containing protein
MSPSRTGEDGFTLMELMVTVAITALIGLVVWQGAVHAQGTTDRMSACSRATIQTVHMERALREQTGHIRMPYWIGSFEFLVDGDAEDMEIPFYEGEAGSFLVVKHAGTSLLIGVRDVGTEELSNIQQFEGVSEITCDVITNDAGEPLGIRYEVYFTGKNNRPVVITAGFGSNPFWYTAR